MRFWIILVVLLLAACSTTQQETQARKEANQELPDSKKVYFFQHRLLPEWTFTSDGNFFNDLLQSDLTKLRAAATKIVSKDYAEMIKTEVVDNQAAVLITFPQPKNMADCFYILIVKKNDDFAFYTYEKTMSFEQNDPVKGIVGIWSKEGSHGNLGPRTYTSSSDFIQDVLSNSG
ncbi:hypothetical protein [Arsukibacterium sp.]|uniref:hypothetical protein n=1 Tax=Arsukibacterium sp. TaxID=1977258 RepID=UPI00299DD0F3|nr:hypothetical protein [Arsukibacterium sp.]MDX1537117.1 hypothetical protein [Arsukibacterium sp.]